MTGTRPPGRPRGPLNGDHYHYLRKLAQGDRWYAIGNSLLESLVTRRMVERRDRIAMRRQYRITESGIRALQSQEAGNEG